MKFCQKCGKELMDEAVICPGCGTPQQANISAPAKVAKTTNDEPKTRKGAVIAAGILLGISIIFLSVFFRQYVWIMAHGKIGTKTLTYAGLMIYTFTYGWMSIIPGFALIIASICTSSSAMKSPLKPIKTTGIVLFVLTIAILVGIIIAYIVPAASIQPVILNS